jgi:sec-independent protein translocase protein TatA
MLLIYPLAFGTWEIVAIVAIIVLLFGGKKIPELMKGVGKGVKSFKEGMNEVEKEVKETENTPDNKPSSTDQTKE